MSKTRTPPEAPHKWGGASTVTLTERQARLALIRGSVRLPERSKVDVLEVYCLGCKRPFEDVADEPCSAITGNEHLRGGPIGERKKRKQAEAALPVGAVRVQITTMRPTG